MSDFASIRKRLHEQLGADAEALAELAAHQLVELDRSKERQADLERDCAEWSEAAAVMERELETLRPEIADLTARCAAANVEAANLRSLLGEAVGMLRHAEWRASAEGEFRDFCPWCGGLDPYQSGPGHNDACPMVSLIDRAGMALR